MHINLFKQNPNNNNNNNNINQPSTVTSQRSSSFVVIDDRVESILNFDEKVFLFFGGERRKEGSVAA